MKPLTQWQSAGTMCKRFIIGYINQIGHLLFAPDRSTLTSKNVLWCNSIVASMAYVASIVVTGQKTMSMTSLSSNNKCQYKFPSGMRWPIRKGSVLIRYHVADAVCLILSRQINVVGMLEHETLQHCTIDLYLQSPTMQWTVDHWFINYMQQDLCNK